MEEGGARERFRSSRCSCCCKRNLNPLVCEQENSSHPIQTAKPSSKNNKKREKKVQRIVLSIPFPLCSFMGFQTPITEVDRPNTIFHFSTFWFFFPLSQPVLPSCKHRRRKRPHGSQDAGDPRRGLKSKKNGMEEKGREGRGRERNRGRSNGQRGQEKKSLRVSRSVQMKEAKKGRRVGSVLHPNGLSCGENRERDKTPTQQ